MCSNLFSDDVVTFWIDSEDVFLFAVTVVDSGTRALQYLGLDGEENSSIGFDVSEFCSMIVNCVWIGC